MKIPLAERLAIQSADELSEVSPRRWWQLHRLTDRQLTEDEVALFYYVVDLTNWLDPFNNFLRPRMEAAKQSVKNSHSPDDGASSNGHGKKPDDAPQITEPPNSILSYFKGEQLQILLMPSELASWQTHLPDLQKPSEQHVQSMRYYTSPPWRKRQATYSAFLPLLTM